MKLRNSEGQTLVETALVLPVILLILMGIIEFGLIFNNYLMVSNASREGARTAAVGATDAQIISLVKNAANLDPSKITITISPLQPVRKKGDEVSITVLYNYNLITPVISAIIPGPLPLSSRAVMRVE